MIMIAKVRALPGYRLLLTTSSGVELERDLAVLIAASGGVVRQLRDPKAFAKVRLDHGTPTWPVLDTPWSPEFVLFGTSCMAPRRPGPPSRSMVIVPASEKRLKISPGSCGYRERVFPDHAEVTLVIDGRVMAAGGPGFDLAQARRQIALAVRRRLGGETWFRETTARIDRQLARAMLARALGNRAPVVWERILREARAFGIVPPRLRRAEVAEPNDGVSNQKGLPAQVNYRGGRGTEPSHGAGVSPRRRRTS
jgi:hypothetical protein